MKRLISFLLAAALIMTMGTMGTPVFADDITVSRRSLPDGKAYQDYRYDLNTVVSGGTGPYTYEMLNDGLPYGLSLSTDGIISGTPKAQATFSDIKIKITDSLGARLDTTFSVYFVPRDVSFVISNYDYTYEAGQTYKATFECIADDVDGDEIEYTATYGPQRLQNVTNAGDYSINLYAPGCNIIHIYDTTLGNEKPLRDMFLSVAKSDEATISVVDKTVAYGTEYDMEVAVSPDHTPYTVEYRKSGTSEILREKPKAVGVYTVTAYTTDPNYITATDTATLTISANAVAFSVSDNETIYNGEGHKVTVTPTTHPEWQEGEDYTVTYKEVLAEEGEPRTFNNDDNLPTDAGTYEIIVTATDPNYSEISVVPNTLTIAKNPVSFEFDPASATVTYDKGTHEVTLTSATEHYGSSYSKGYTVSYSKDGEPLDGSLPTDAGEYAVSVEVDDPNYTVESVTPEFLTINPKKIKFTIDPDSTTVEYDGGPHSATITAQDESGIPFEDSYTVVYQKNGGAEYENSVSEVGEYTITIRVSSDNYTAEITNPEAAKMTISFADSFSIEKGNSPAAKTDEELLAFGINRDIYKSINGNALDTDEYTVIVKDLSDYHDAGMTVTTASGTQTVAGSSPAQEGGDPNLYKVTYSYNGEVKFTRYIMVVGRIGDVNGNGNVNTLDANAIDKYLSESPVSSAAQNVSQARVWDVNKDGNITSADADAIRNRYTAPLTSYYPWID